MLDVGNNSRTVLTSIARAAVGQVGSHRPDLPFFPRSCNALLSCSMHDPTLLVDPSFISLLFIQMFDLGNNSRTVLTSIARAAVEEEGSLSPSSISRTEEGEEEDEEEGEDEDDSSVSIITTIAEEEEDDDKEEKKEEDDADDDDDDDDDDVAGGSQTCGTVTMGRRMKKAESGDM